MKAVVLFLFFSNIRRADSFSVLNKQLLWEALFYCQGDLCVRLMHFTSAMTTVAAVSLIKSHTSTRDSTRPQMNLSSQLI